MAHKVKGSAAMMGLDVLSGVAADAEIALRDSRDRDAVTELAATLRGTADQLADRAA